MIITCPEISIRPDGCFIEGTKLNSPPTLNEFSDLLGINPSFAGNVRGFYLRRKYVRFCFHGLGLTLYNEAPTDKVAAIEIDLTKKFIFERVSPEFPYPGTLFYCPTQNEKIQLFASMNSNTCVQLGLTDAQYGWFEKQFPDFLFQVEASEKGLRTIYIVFISEKEAPTD